LQAASLDGGFIIVVPAPKYLLKQLSNKLRHLWNNLRHAAWPMPIWGVFGGVGAFVSVRHTPNLSPVFACSESHTWLCLGALERIRNVFVASSISFSAPIFPILRGTSGEGKSPAPTEANHLKAAMALHLHVPEIF
jgi:hypothetical protein